LGRPERSIK